MTIIFCPVPHSLITAPVAPSITFSYIISKLERRSKDYFSRGFPLDSLASTVPSATLAARKTGTRSIWSRRAELFEWLDNNDLFPGARDLNKIKVVSK